MLHVPPDALAQQATGNGSHATIQPGDLVVVYERFNAMKAVYVDPSKVHDTKFGGFQMKVSTTAALLHS